MQIICLKLKLGKTFIFFPWISNILKNFEPFVKIKNEPNPYCQSFSFWNPGNTNLTSIKLQTMRFSKILTKWRQMNIIISPPNLDCPRIECNRNPLRLSERGDSYYCDSCRKYFSIKRGTILFLKHLSAKHIEILVYCFIHNYKVLQTVDILDSLVLTQEEGRTITADGIYRYNNYFRRLISFYMVIVYE